VVDLNTRVDNVSAGTCTSSAVVSVRGGTTALAGDTSETPGRRGLGDVGLLLDFSEVGLDNSILLDVVDLKPYQQPPIFHVELSITYTGQVAEQLNNVISHVSRETAETTKLVDMSGVLPEKLQGSVDEVVKVLVLHLDNVSSWDGSTSAGNDDWRRQGKSHWQKGDEE
jgi:hypothetical protein